MTVGDLQREKTERFHRMHLEGDILVLPNAWDHASAALMVAAGFPAIATTSAGIANSLGFADGEAVGRERMLEVAGAIAAHAAVPVTADLEAGYGIAPEAVAECVAGAVAAGLAGCNIEDADPVSRKLYDFDLAVERVRAGAEAARQAGLPRFVLNARTDPYLKGFGDAEACFAEAVRRGNAYLAAGAACIFVPGPLDGETAGRLAAAIDGPVNILAGFPGQRSLTAADYARRGVRRLSIGGSLMLATLALVRDSLAAIRAEGGFGYALAAMPHADANALLSAWRDGGSRPR